METLFEYLNEAIIVVSGWGSLVILVTLWWAIAGLIRERREDRNNKLRADRDVTGERLGRYSDSNGVDPDDE